MFVEKFGANVEHASEQVSMLYMVSDAGCSIRGDGVDDGTIA